jgi:hypothetical protein
LAAKNRNLAFLNWNVCFSRKRTFKSLENHKTEGPLTAKSSHSVSLAKMGKMAEESYSVVNSTKGRSTSLFEYAGCAFKAVIQ